MLKPSTWHPFGTYDEALAEVMDDLEHQAQRSRAIAHKSTTEAGRVAYERSEARARVKLRAVRYARNHLRDTDPS